MKKRLPDLIREYHEAIKIYEELNDKVQDLFADKEEREEEIHDEFEYERYNSYVNNSQLFDYFLHDLILLHSFQ